MANLANENTVETLPAALERERERVRELMPLYRQIGPTGAFAVVSMKLALVRASAAVANGDVVAMLRSYEELKEFRE